MRKMVMATLVGGGITVFLMGGTGLALADDDDDRNRVSARSGQVVAAAPQAAAPRFELEIDPELDAQFPNRPVNGAEAAEIVVDAIGGGQVTEVELDEEDGRPYWEVKAEFQGREVEVNVDAFNGDLIGDDD